MRCTCKPIFRAGQSVSLLWLGGNDEQGSPGDNPGLMPFYIFTNGLDK